MKIFYAILVLLYIVNPILSFNNTIRRDIYTTNIFSNTIISEFNHVFDEDIKPIIIED